MTKRSNRREVPEMADALGAAASAAPLVARAVEEEPRRDALGACPRLRAAALEFGVTPKQDAPTNYTGRFTGAVVRKVAGPLKATITLLEDGDRRVCLVTSAFNSMLGTNVSDSIRRAIADDLNLPVANVVLFSAHNHSDVSLVSNPVFSYADPPKAGFPAPDWLPVGRELFDQCRSHAKRLVEMLQPATVWWAEGSEGRITYNQKGRRADGSTYFMREEDRDLLGADFNGDIDRQAPIVVLKNQHDEPVAALTQFAGHPCTCYHPERPVVFGEWPQVACNTVAEHLAPSGTLPVGFLQGCAADVNSKGMLRCGVEESVRYGRMLGQSYIEALGTLRVSQRDGFDYSVERAKVPLASLPIVETLQSEIAEMEDFIQRGTAGDEDALECVGLNFSKELSPSYRGKLVEAILPWSCWALEMHQSGRADTVPKFLEADIHVLRVGDVGIVGMPFEPFLGIGRQIRRRSPLPLAIPCGYTNISYGYLPDGPNTGDREYMSAFYRYTKFRPPYRKPAGDVLVDCAVQAFRLFA